jgi:hypothetical protein
MVIGWKMGAETNSSSSSPLAWLSWRLPPWSRRWRSAAPDETGTGAHPASRASYASLAKRSTPAISPISLTAVMTPQALRGQQLRSDRGDQVGEFPVELVDRAREVTNPPDDPDSDRRFSTAQGRAICRWAAALRNRALEELQPGQRSCSSQQS